MTLKTAAVDSTPVQIRVASPNVIYTPEAIQTTYSYSHSKIHQEASPSQNQGVLLTVEPTQTEFDFKISRTLPRTGLMMVGWGGNNGSTLTAAILANRQGLAWRTKEGLRSANYFGSLTQASTVRLGSDSVTGKDVFVPFSALLPMVSPNDLVLGGWDISALNLGAAMERAQVLDYDLQRQLRDSMEALIPLPSIYYPDFIAANQEERADNLIPGSKSDHLAQIRVDIRNYKEKHQLDKVVVVWTANTERYADIIPGVNDSQEHLLAAIQKGHPEIAPSTIFATASILEGCPFINGSPQNTFVPGVICLAETHDVFVGGDDFKSGQTKLKSVLVDFLVNAGIKPLAITSYNHLGNNDGKNLSAPEQFRSKEISKSNVVDDMVEANRILYKEGESPDHIVVIKYCPSVGDSKRALDEYVSEIFMGGRSTISIYNQCEDSLLAAPLVLDLVLITELFTRITYRTDKTADYAHFHPVLSLLSYMLKAPVVPKGAPVVNALAKQRAALENIMRACIGLPPDSDMNLEHRIR